MVAINAILPCVWSSLWLATVPLCSAFHLPRQSDLVLPTSPSTAPNGRRPHRGLAATGSAFDGDAVGGEAQDLRSFVTQRCIQSFMYLLSTTRDLHTVRWLDAFVQPITINNYWDEDADFVPGAEDTFRDGDKRIGSKLLTYHGLAALNTTTFPTWDAFFTSLLEQPATVLEITTPRDAGRRAYSDFDIEIEPARLCARILSVREQIARELSGDLRAISKMGQGIFAAYWENSKKRKTTGTEGGAAGDGEESAPFGFDHPSTMYITFDPHDDDAFAPSPLHKASFDLLYTLITQSAVTELLQSEDGVVVSEDPLENHLSRTFLASFYEERLSSHFVGNQYYGKGDAFVEELMLASPVLLSRKQEGGAEEDAGDPAATGAAPLAVEPLRIAEQILLKRDKLALEWAEVMEGVPSEHTDIRKLQLDSLTGATKTETSKTIVEDEFQ